MRRAAQQRSAQEAAPDRRLLWQRLRRIAGFGWPYRYRLLGGILISGLSVLVALVLPLGLRELLDAAIYEGSRTSLDRLALLLLSLYVLRAGLNLVGPLVLQLTGERITMDLRQKVYAHLHVLDIRYHASQRTADLVSRLAGDVAAIRTAITDIFTSFLLQGWKLAGSIGLMLFLNWRLSLVIFAVTPIATILTRRWGPVVQQISREVQDRQAASNAVAQEALSGVRLVRSFDRGRFEVKRYAESLGVLYGSMRRAVFASTTLNVLVELVFMVAIVAIFWSGGREVLAGRLTAGDFVAFMFYAQNISGGISEVIRLYTSAHRTVGASGRVFELLDIAPEVTDAPGARALPKARGEIEFANVSFHYDKAKPVLRNVCFSIDAGEHLALVGLSGAGKTTLFNLLVRFFDPAEGGIRLDGVDLREIRLSSLRNQISIVSQDVYLFGGTIRDNIRYGRLSASDAEIEAAAEAAQLREVIRELPQGFDTPVGENGVLLSGGQRQRIAIARAILKDAPVLLLDEATSSVDVSAENAIREATDALRRDRTTLIITHRLESIRKIPRILILDRGMILSDGTHAELTSHPGLYRELVLDGGGEAAATKPELITL